jgi:hypothetical protein
MAHLAQFFCFHSIKNEAPDTTNWVGVHIDHGMTVNNVTKEATSWCVFLDFLRNKIFFSERGARAAPFCGLSVARHFTLTSLQTVARSSFRPFVADRSLQTRRVADALQTLKTGRICTHHSILSPPSFSGGPFCPES